MSDLASDPDIARIESFCRNVVGTAGNLIEWEWDYKFLLMIGVLDLERGEDVREILENTLSHRFQHDTETIPRPVVEVLGGLGGLRSGQLMLTSDPGLDPMIFCAWWPWRRQPKVSLRMSCWSAKLEGQARSEFRRMFRNWFERPDAA